MKIRSATVGPVMTNCYLLCDETQGVCALIDPGDETERLERMVADSGCELRCILLTHGHFDHCNAVRPLLEKHPDVPVYIHEADVTDGDPGPFGLLFPRLDGAHQRYYKEGDRLTLGSLTLTVMETPGHSKGSVCLVVDDVIFSGDTLFRTNCGRTDFPGGDYREMLSSLARLGRMAGSYHVCPGHDRETDLDYERLVNPYMQQGLRNT
jgi:glyoxylase-like metal-dependent hydrolase (beta-lactamase superfamily II)